MGDKAITRQRLSDLITADEKYCIFYENECFTDIIVGDTTNVDFFRMIIKWNQAGLIPAMRRVSGVLPIGLVQMEVPYEDIHSIVRFKVEADMLAKIPSDILNYFNNTNLEQGCDVAQWYGKDNNGIDQNKNFPKIG